jgi:xanthine dehydrogenase YagS FAD-binding subunit
VLALLSPEPGKTEILAGGTDLIGLMKRMIMTPDRVVNVSDVESMSRIEHDRTDHLWIGAGVRLIDFLDSPTTDAYPAVKQVIQGISSIQLQSQGTIGGELLRRPCCWYFRSGEGLLAKNGTRVVEGDNRFHAILGNRGAAKFVSASRLAPALISLSASVRIVGPSVDDEQFVPLETLYQIPRNGNEREHTLNPNQLLTHIVVPPPNGHLSAAYEVRHGEGPDQPLAAAAAVLQVVDGIVRQAKIVMGQVAPVPWISDDAAKALIGNFLTAESAATAGAESVRGAMALSKNEYKIQLAQVAVKRAILRAAGLDTGGF